MIRRSLVVRRPARPVRARALAVLAVRLSAGLPVVAVRRTRVVRRHVAGVGRPGWGWGA
jgi:hypothetical protein